MYCENCGNKLDNNQKFCENCGKKKVETATKRNIFKLSIDIICYTVSIILILIFTLFLLIERNISAFIGILWGLSYAPLIYSLIQKKLNLKSTTIYRLLIPLIMFVIFIISFMIYAITDTDYSDESHNNKIEEAITSIPGDTNPWKTTQDYNGVYTFEYEYSSTNIVKGVLEINNDNINLDYNFTGGTSTTMTNRKGFCGIDDSNKFYMLFKSISGNDEYNSIYNCEKKDNTLSCKKTYKYDFIGYTNATELNYQKSDKTFSEISDSIKREQEISVAARQEEEKRKKEELENEKRKQQEAEINSYEEYSYEQLARNPSAIKGNKVKVTGEIMQVISNGLLVSITYNGYFYTDEIFVKYTQKNGKDKLLENDIITVYGIADGEYSYYTVLGAEKTVPRINSKSIKLNK